MRRSIPLALLAAALCPPAAMAGSAGSSAFEFLTIDVGPRQAGMGGAGAAVADDLLGADANPAGLGRLWRREAAFLHASWFQGVQFQYLGYAHPTVGAGTFAAGLFNLGYGDIQGYGASGQKSEEIKAHDRMLSASYGRALRDDLWSGARAAYIQERLHANSAGAFSTDLGLLYGPVFNHWLDSASPRFGLTLRRLGTRPRFVEDSAPLPRTLTLGLAARPYFEGLTLAVDLSRPEAGPPSAHVGLEYWAKSVVAFRLGYNGEQDIGNGIGFGIAVKAWTVQMDYAFSDLGQLGLAHRMSLTYRFGSVAEKIFEKGMNHMREQDYANALIDFSRVLSVDYRHERAAQMLKEANERLQRQINDTKP